MPLPQINGNTWYVDVEYLGTPRLIATAVLEAGGGLLLIDPGPEVSFDTLSGELGKAGAGLGDVRAVLLTHIHLDHAGATGRLVAEAPHVEVYVHRIGAPHLVRPERLLRSARRTYGDRMDRLWGDVQPVPEENVRVLEGGESIKIGGRPFAVAHTPGHAAHHVSHLDEDTGTAFIGDVGQQRITGTDYVFPVTPPPDIDVEAWQHSLHTVRAWRPERTFATHFGPSDDVGEHLRVAEEKLLAWSDEVRRSLDDDRTDAERAEAFREAKMAEAKEALPPELAEAFETFGGPEASWHGLARYWRTKRAGEGENG